MLFPLTLVRAVVNAVARLRDQSGEPAGPTAVALPVEERPRGRAGKYDQALLAIVDRQPGVTVAQAAERLDVTASALYPVIRRLETRDALVKRGPGLFRPVRAGESVGRQGKYDQRLAAIVAGRPGLTVADAAAQLDVHPTALYPVIRRLVARGVLVKRGRGLHPG